MNNRNRDEVRRADMTERDIGKEEGKQVLGEKAQKTEMGFERKEAEARRTLPRLTGSTGKTEGLTEE